MNIYFLTAGILCFLLGVVHSTLGEYLIFKHKRVKGTLVPSKHSETLKKRHLRILWATWHLASIFGWYIGVLLTKISMEKAALNADFIDFLTSTSIYTMFISSLLVAIGTKGKHPAWVVFLVIGILLIIGSYHS